MSIESSRMSYLRDAPCCVRSRRVRLDHQGDTDFRDLTVARIIELGSAFWVRTDGSAYGHG